MWVADVSNDDTAPFSGRKVCYHSNGSNIFIRKAGVRLPYASRRMPESVYYVIYVLKRAVILYPLYLCIIVIIIIIISFMHGIYTHILETNYVPREYSVAAILLLLFMVLISLVSVLNLL